MLGEPNVAIGPHVRVAGDGVDVLIQINDVDDLDIAHRAVDLAFERFKKKNEPKQPDSEKK